MCLIWRSLGSGSDSWPKAWAQIRQREIASKTKRHSARRKSFGAECVSMRLPPVLLRGVTPPFIYRLGFTQACRAYEYPAKSGRGSAKKSLPSAAWEADAKNIQVAQVVELAKTGASNLQIRMDLVNKYLRPFVIEHLDS